MEKIYEVCIRNARRNYVYTKSNGVPEVTPGYSFSINKKFHGFVAKFSDTLWVAFDVYTGKAYGKGNTRKEAILCAVKNIQSYGFDKILRFISELKVKKTPRGVNSRALKL